MTRGLIPACAGKPRPRRPRIVPPRLIPACAGKTAVRRAGRLGPRAHPRVCGENRVHFGPGGGLEGSSPRVRGKPGVRHPPGRPPGLIPACAGKTLATPAMLVCLGAHPRVCGENTRGRTMSRPVPGSSPRVRGKPRAGLQEAARRGLIPACAGKTRETLAWPGVRWAHPRACGENMQQSAGAVESVGSSPRVRGKRSRGGSDALENRLIPARAGKTGPTPGKQCPSRAHPRACGENGSSDSPRVALAGSSPRVRGKLGKIGPPLPGVRLIPARAGKTRGRPPQRRG